MRDNEVPILEGHDSVGCGSPFVLNQHLDASRHASDEVAQLDLTNIIPSILSMVRFDDFRHFCLLTRPLRGF